MTNEEQKIYNKVIAHSGELKKLIIYQMIKKGITASHLMNKCGFTDDAYVKDWLRGTLGHTASRPSPARDAALTLLGITIEVKINERGEERVKIICNE